MYSNSAILVSDRRVVKGKVVNSKDANSGRKIVPVGHVARMVNKTGFTPPSPLSSHSSFSPSSSNNSPPVWRSRYSSLPTDALASPAPRRYSPVVFDIEKITRPMRRSSTLDSHVHHVCLPFQHLSPREKKPRQTLSTVKKTLVFDAPSSYVNPDQALAHQLSYARQTRKPGQVQSSKQLAFKPSKQTKSSQQPKLMVMR